MSASTLTSPAAPAAADRPAAAAPPARRIRGVWWLTWRQTRVTARTVGILLLLAVVALVAFHFLHQELVERVRQSNCYPAGRWSDTGCWVRVGRVEMLGRAFTDIVQPAVTAVPVLLGMFLGGPLLAQEYERGTVRMVLAQSVTPRRWLAARLAVPGAVVLVSTGVLAVLTSWVWWADIIHGPVVFDPPFQGFTYSVLGPIPVVWSLFAVALGVLVGQLLRRTVAAVLVSGVLVAVAHAVVFALRPYFYPMVEQELPYDRMMGGFMQPANAWLVERGVVLADGTRLTEDACTSSAADCSEAVLSWGRFHPVSHLVPIQLVEAGLLLALTALILFVVFRRLTRAGV
ncbi:hypothetical protein [Kitasatospora sp. NPDC093806]|uniref:hypothetical protein n=1 Tax=Kitasatospora sp. NPDC093806 TaxID=3155075 RepID=UPI0034272C6E